MSSSNPTVSIIVPVYNTEKHLRRCVDSILAQTLSEIEVILVDDGSPDGSPQIVDEYAKKDPRVIAVHKPNGGLSSARNAGLEQARAPYVGFIDSDDYVAPDMFEKLLAGLKNSGADFSSCGIQCEFEFGGADVDQNYYDIKFSGLVPVDVRFFEKSDVSVCNKLFIRELIEKGAPIRFPDGLNFEDSEFFWRYALRAKTIFCVQENLYRYVRHGSGIMKETMTGFNAHSIDAVKVCGNILRELKVTGRFEDFGAPFFFLLAGHYGLSAKSAHPETDSETRKILKEADYPKYKHLIPDSESWVRECLDAIWQGKEPSILKKIVYTKTCKGVRRTFFCGIRIHKKQLQEVIPGVQEETLPAGTPKVSIVVPVYNTERYLARALDSICNQTLKELEIICIDDGSTDASLKILKAYAEKDSRIRVISKPNAGYGHSVNLGMSHARGEYVAIVEPDDYIAPTMHETLYAVAKKHQVPLAKCDWELFWEQDGIETKRERWRLVDTDSVSVFSPASNPTMCADASGIWAAIYNRTWLNQNGIRCLETPGASFQDTAFVMKTYLCAGKMAFVPKPFVSYRQTNPNSSINAGAGKALAVFAEFDEIIRFCKARAIFNEKNRALILKKMHATGKWNWERFTGDVRARVETVLRKYFRAMLAKVRTCPPELCASEWDFILKIADVRESGFSKLKYFFFRESYSKDSVRVKLVGIRILRSPLETNRIRNSFFRKLVVRLLALGILGAQERKCFRARHLNLNPRTKG